jgi:hypothetical protein
MSNKINIFGKEKHRDWLNGAEIIGDKRYVNEKDKYKAADDTPGTTTSLTFTDAGGNTHTITVKNGLITDITTV